MIFRLLRSLLIILASTSFLVAQTDSNNMLYKRLEGVTDSANLQANIIRQAEQISGNYELSITHKEATTIDVAGTIDEDNNAVINQLGNNEPVMKGILLDDRFTGIWKSGETEKNIELFESYPDGSIPLNIYYLHSEENLIEDDAKSPSAEIELTVIYPDNSLIEDGSLIKINNIITKHFIETEEEILHPDSLLINVEKEFYILYREENKDWHYSGNSFGWIKETSMSVTYNSNHILCLEYLDYVYTGGAHGMSNLQYDIIDLDTENKISFRDIFNEGSEDQLTKILTQQLRNNKQIPDNLSLTESGYFVEEIKPGKIIYVNGSGIGFIYNSYEIAPYSTGITNIFLNYKQLDGLLKPNILISSLIR